MERKNKKNEKHNNREKKAKSKTPSFISKFDEGKDNYPQREAIRNVLDASISGIEVELGDEEDF